MRARTCKVREHTSEGVPMPSEGAHMPSEGAHK
jgi:hypothetical protein